MRTLVPAPTPHATQGFRPAAVLLVATAILLAISAASTWHAERFGLPRYCAEPELALQRLAALEKGETAQSARRANFLVAKLEFMVPRGSDETLDAYLERVRRTLGQRCPRQEG